MSNELYTLVPMISIVMSVLSFTMKIYKRSISAFISILMVMISSNLMFYGYIDCGLVSIILFMIVMFYRAIIKPENDTFLIKKYNGVERRKS